MKNTSIGTRLPSSRFSLVVITNATSIGKERRDYPHKEQFLLQFFSDLSKKTDRIARHLCFYDIIITYPRRIHNVWIFLSEPTQGVVTGE